jgi:hypothetical protein
MRPDRPLPLSTFVVALVTVGCRKDLPEGLPRAYLNEAIRIAEQGVTKCPDLLGKGGICIGPDNPASSLVPEHSFGGADELTVLIVGCRYPKRHPKAPRWCNAPSIWKRDGVVRSNGAALRCDGFSHGFGSWDSASALQSQIELGEMTNVTSVEVPKDPKCSTPYVNLSVIRGAPDGSVIEVFVQFDQRKLLAERDRPQADGARSRGSQKESEGVRHESAADGRPVPAATKPSPLDAGAGPGKVSGLAYATPPCKLVYDFEATGTGQNRFSPAVSYTAKVTLTPRENVLVLRHEHKDMGFTGKEKDQLPSSMQEPRNLEGGEKIDLLLAGSTMKTKEGVVATSPGPTAGGGAHAVIGDLPTLFPTLPSAARSPQTTFARWAMFGGERAALLRHEERQSGTDEEDPGTDPDEPVATSDCHFVSQYLFLPRGWLLYGEVKGSCTLSWTRRRSKRAVIPAETQRFEMRQFLREACVGPVATWKDPPQGTVDR